MKFNLKKWPTLFGILALAFVLRMMGLKWGAPSPSVPHYPFQPDEQFSMGILADCLNFHRFHFNVLDAHREGTLGHYIWTITVLFLHWMGVINTLPRSGYDFANPGFRQALLSCRIVSILFDVASTALVYLVSLRITRKETPALLGAFIFAIIPFEVIQSEWMRPHTMANFFVLLALYYSTFLVDKASDVKHLELKIGLCCGFATATRYPSLVVFLFPFLLLCFNVEAVQFADKLQWLAKRASTLWLYWLLGFFLADPWIFINWHDARRAVFTQASYADAHQFKGLSGILSIAKIWPYLERIIPYGTFPLLWSLFYFALIYLLFQGRWRKWFFPLLATALLNLWLMTKGYTQSASFTRTVIFLFPFLAISAAMAVQSFTENYIRRRLFLGASLTALSVILSTTILFDVVYARSLSENTDPRMQLFRYLSQNANGLSRVGLTKESSCNYFISGSPLQVLSNARMIQFEERNLARFLSGEDPIQFLVIGGPRAVDGAAEVAELVSSGRFDLLRTFENFPHFLQWKFDYSDIPADMIYPFPTIYLLEAHHKGPTI